MSEERRVHQSYQTYFNEKYWQKQHLVMPGEYICSDSADEILVAETGAGVIVCIYDMEAHVGGLAHVLVPDEIIRDFKDKKDHQKKVIEYAKHPLEALINSLKRNGAGKKRINIRLSGGANIMNDEFDMGLKNVVFAQNEIIDKGLRLITQDIGGKNCRRVHFFPYTGRMETHPLRRQNDMDELWRREREYLEKVKKEFKVSDGADH